MTSGWEVATPYAKRIGVDVQVDIIVKYCGGCNCQIDRSRLIGDIKKFLPSGYRLISEVETAPAEAGILICGCQSACADKPELSDLARRWILVAGKSVDHRDAPEDKLAEGILQTIQEIKNRE